MSIIIEEVSKIALSARHWLLNWAGHQADLGRILA